MDTAKLQGSRLAGLQAFGVLTLCGHNPKLSAFVIRTRDRAATPTGFAEIVGDDFPLFHPSSIGDE
jgi:hypothetical protein